MVAVTFSDLSLKASYTSADDRVNGFFVPLLSEAVTYDRVSGYFRSSSLVSVSRGLAKFLENEDARMRLVVGADFSEQDLRAIEKGADLADRLIRQWENNSERFLSDDVISRQRLEVLAWLLGEGRIEIRVGVPVDITTGLPLRRDLTDAYFHAKYGVFTDRDGNKVAFDGSNNETAAGLETNFEAFSVFPSWKPEVWGWNGTAICDRFEAHWNGDVGRFWTVVPLPEAIADGLVKRVRPERRPQAKDPEERSLPASQQPSGGTSDNEDHDEPAPPTEIPLEEWESLKDLLDAPSIKGGTGVGYVTSGISPWPHQIGTAKRIVDTFPRSYMLADEVGLGKTIEVGLALRELLVTGRAQRALLMVPASVMKQWQEEMWEKFALLIPRLESGKFVWRRNGRDVQTSPAPQGADLWNSNDLLIASSHLVRRKGQRTGIKQADPWDVVVVDEAHHARAKRRKRNSKEQNEMLRTLEELKKNGSWKAVWLATATPMQMHAHEAWDLLELLDLNGKWAASDQNFLDYYEELSKPFEERNWGLLKEMTADFMADPEAKTNPHLDEIIAEKLTTVEVKRIRDFGRYGIRPKDIPQWKPEARELLREWLLFNNPTRERVFRATREQLHHYQKQGLLDATIPERNVQNIPAQMTPQERDLYDRLEQYIIRSYNAYMSNSKTQGYGFIMTIYRRRLTSSFEAVKKSLMNRRQKLINTNDAYLLDEDDLVTLEESAPSLDKIDASIPVDKEILEQEIDELTRFIRDCEALPGDESKMAHLTKELSKQFTEGQRTAIIFTQYTDTMKYVANRLAQTYGTQVACWSGNGGERYSPDDETADPWKPIDKPELKRLFREGRDVKILVGTDSMSEGLNLQTCGLLINYDLPWNFMRVEQRIGRADRIGGQPEVHVLNYMYLDTIEEQIIRGIDQNHKMFQYIIGDAQPVIASLETTMQDVIMTDTSMRDQKLREALEETSQNIEHALVAPIKLSDIGSAPQEIPQLDPAITLDQIEQTLTSATLTSPWFIRNPIGPSGSWIYIESSDIWHQVTFRSTVADDNSQIELLTYLHPLMTQILDRIRPHIHADATVNATAGSATLKTEVKPKKSHHHHGVAVLDLINAQIIQPGTQLVSTNGNWPGTATILPDGTFRVGEKTFPSPSAAGKHVCGGLSTNGWTTWAVQFADGSQKDLAKYRDEYLRRQSENNDS